MLCTHVICIRITKLVTKKKAEVENLERRIEAEGMPELVARITQEHVVLHIQVA
jgi:hypothetical protein